MMRNFAEFSTNKLPSVKTNKIETFLSNQEAQKIKIVKKLKKNKTDLLNASFEKDFFMNLNIFNICQCLNVANLQCWLNNKQN